MATIYWSTLLVLVGVFRGLKAFDYPDFSNLEKNVYSTISPGIFFRLTNHQKQIGSSAGIGGVQGVLWYIRTQNDIDQLVGGVAPHPPYIALIDPNSTEDAVALSSRSNLLSLSMSNRVVGVVIVHNTVNTPLGSGYTSSNFSPVMSCDNEGFGWNNQETCSHQWNPFANNLLYHDFQDFPIMVIGDATPFKNCFEKFMQSNIPTSYPLCAAELTADMSVAVSTESCYRRAYLPMPFLTVGGFSCDALGGLSVWGTPFHLPNTSQDVIMVTTKLDTLSMFPRSASLGGGEAAGIVALLAMAEAIGQLKRKGELENTTKSIIFTFFNGESWDYIGSSRLVHDMARKDFTSFDIDQISHFVELSHLGFTNHTAKQSLYYAHLHRDDNIFRNLAMFAKSNNISIAKAVGSALPPSSLLSFLKANSSISSVVLGDYDGGYINRFYGSRFDTIDNLAYVNDSITFNASLEKVAERLAKVSSALAATVLELSGAACASNSCHPVANKELVKDLVECFLRNFSCPRFQEAIPDSVDMPNSTVIGYVGIFRSRNQAPQVYLPNAVRNLLTYYLGDWTANVTAKQCDNISMDGYSQRIFSRGPSYNSSADTPTGTCVLANTFFLNSLSPVFEGENRETYRSDLVGEYSSWAESSWITLQVRLYITTGLGEELGTFFGGLVLFGIFILLSIQLFRRGRNIFHQRIIPPSDDAEQ